MLKVQNLTKHFGENKAVNDVSFAIEKGEIFSLIGPNSSGKTTIIKSITGLLEPTSGIITIDGHDVSKNGEKTKSLVGYIPDEPSIWSYMTGREFLYFTQALFGIPEEQRAKNIAEYLGKFNLTDLDKNYFEEYSRGNRQKFSIISAIAHHPKLLVIDEPIVGLDPTGAEIAKKLFVEHAKNGGSVLLVTHTLSVAEEISDRIGFLNNGTLVITGTLSELRQKAGLDEHAKLEDIYKKLV